MEENHIRLRGEEIHLDVSGLRAAKRAPARTFGTTGWFSSGGPSRVSNRAPGSDPGRSIRSFEGGRR